MKRTDAPILGCLLVCLVFLPSCAPAGSSTTACNVATQWRPPADNVQLRDVAMVSPDEGWAVGNTSTLSGSSAGVIYHFLHGQWVRLPQTYANSPLAALSMDSPNDGWAFSAPNESPIGRVPVLHYSLGAWRPVDIPALDKIANTGGFFNQVSVQIFGPNAGWMFAQLPGYTPDPADPNPTNGMSLAVILRYENGVWTPIAAPPFTSSTGIFDLSAASANDAWIVGVTPMGGGNQTTVFAHYLNGAWSLWPRTFAGVAGESITMLSPSDGWATADKAGEAPVVLHYNGTAWAPVVTPTQWTSQGIFIWRTSQGISLLGVALALGSDVTWIGITPAQGSEVRPVLEQYAHGHWKQITWPFPTVTPEALAAATASGSELWGVGNILHQEGCGPALVTDIFQGAFLHFQQGQWSEQMLP